MKHIFLFIFICLHANKTIAQTTAIQFNGEDCNAIPVNLFSDLDSGKAVLLHFFMANCGSCIPAAQTLKTMGDHINALYPGLVKGYAFAFDNTTSCSYASNWVSVNGLDGFYAPMDSGASQVNYYGGFGMPTVILLGGSNHRVMYGSQVFNTSDTTFLRDSIVNILNSSSLNSYSLLTTSLKFYPNPASDALYIELNLKEKSQITLEIIDITGRKINTIINEKLAAGAFAPKADISFLQNGSYFLKLTTQGVVSTKSFNILH
ncbi:MAG: T9SS type A sorting domain-containing protein [Ferruginibacter sp.]